MASCMFEEVCSCHVNISIHVIPLIAANYHRVGVHVNMAIVA